MKALQQVALVIGAWTTAAMLLPTRDPLGREQFGGEERELAAVHRYQKGARDLRQGLTMLTAKPDVGEQ